MGVLGSGVVVVFVGFLWFLVLSHYRCWYLLGSPLVLIDFEIETNKIKNNDL